MYCNLTVLARGFVRVLEKMEADEDTADIKSTLKNQDLSFLQSNGITLLSYELANVSLLYAVTLN